MSWYPKGYLFSTENLVHAIFDRDSDENKLLVKAALGDIELHAKANSWNAVLWLITSMLKEDGESIYSGKELGELKSSLPIVWVAK